jgi:hypothetical protein
VAFLVDNREMKYSTLNGYRSAIASVLSIIHPNNKPVADTREMVDFFKAKRRSEIRIKTHTQLETWDINILIQYIKSTLSPSEDLNLYDLQQKVMLLLCIHTMWCPRSDIGRIQHRDIYTLSSIKFLMKLKALQFKCVNRKNLNRNM